MLYGLMTPEACQVLSLMEFHNLLGKYYLENSIDQLYIQHTGLIDPEARITADKDKYHSDCNKLPTRWGGMGNMPEGVLKQEYGLVYDLDGIFHSAQPTAEPKKRTTYKRKKAKPQTQTDHITNN